MVPMTTTTTTVAATTTDVGDVTPGAAVAWLEARFERAWTRYGSGRAESSGGWDVTVLQVGYRGRHADTTHARPMYELFSDLATDEAWWYEKTAEASPAGGEMRLLYVRVAGAAADWPPARDWPAW